MKQSEIETRFIRLSAYVAALESALAAIIDHLPNQSEVLQAMDKSDKAFDDLALSHDFSDEELDAFQLAREKFLSLITKRGS